MNNRLNRLWIALGFAAVVATAGCGSRGPQPQSQEQLSHAQASLRTGLEAWKKGEPAKAWIAAGAPIRMVDEDWKAGYRLVDYSIKKAEGNQGDNSLCFVVLSLQDRNGKKMEKSVAYGVSSTQPVSILRDPFN